MQVRLTWAGGIVLALFMAAAGGFGLFATWQVVRRFQTGGDIVQWQDGPDLVVMSAPLLAGLVVLACHRLGFGWRLWPILPLMLAFGILLGKGDAWLLGRVAANHGYRSCEHLDVWDPHGGRGGGPALTSWGYSRLPCPTR